MRQGTQTVVLDAFFHNGLKLFQCQVGNIYIFKGDFLIIERIFLNHAV